VLYGNKYIAKRGEKVGADSM